jgi:hypothetical protein
VANNYEQYEFENDLQHFQSIRNIRIDVNQPYHIVKQPYILENLEFFNIKRQLNQEQATTMKDKLTKKNIELNKLVHLFLIGHVRTVVRKTGPRSNKIKQMRK